MDQNRTFDGDLSEMMEMIKRNLSEFKSFGDVIGSNDSLLPH